VFLQNYDIEIVVS